MKVISQLDIAISDSNNPSMRRLSQGKGPSPAIMLRLPESLYTDVRSLAEKDRRSMVDYVRLVLIDHVEAQRKRKRRRGR